MLQKYNKRVSLFAREMLVKPCALEVRTKSVLTHHNIQPLLKNESTVSFMQEPMRFGSFETEAERVALVMLKNNSQIDTSPSRRTLLGSDEAVMNLRTTDK